MRRVAIGSETTPSQSFSESSVRRGSSKSPTAHKASSFVEPDEVGTAGDAERLLEGEGEGGDSKNLKARSVSTKARPGTQSVWLIDPRTQFMRRWDILTLWLLAFTALVTPYEAGGGLCKLHPVLKPTTTTRVSKL